MLFALCCLLIFMHEVSVALSLLDIVEEKCREGGFHSVESVRVRVGKASGILPEALSFAFEAVKKETIARKAKFIMDVVPLGGYCNGCQRKFESQEPYILECPLCSSSSFKINQGQELEIVEMEVH